MKKTMRSWNSTLRSESQKHREMRLAGLLPKKTPKPMRKISANMQKRISDWRQTAKEICTRADGHLYCPLCGNLILDGYEAHHWKERRGQAHSVANDKYVVALHPHCHQSIDHNSNDFYLARDKIRDKLCLWGIDPEA